MIYLILLLIFIYCAIVLIKLECSSKFYEEVINGVYLYNDALIDSLYSSNKLTLDLVDKAFLEQRLDYPNLYSLPSYNGIRFWNIFDWSYKKEIDPELLEKIKPYMKAE